MKAFAPALLIAGMATNVLAQGVQTGSLRGTVKDLQGRPVSDAQVTVTSPALQGRRTRTTGSNGDYAFGALPPGDYQATFGLSGVETARRSTRVWLGLPTRLDVTIGTAEGASTAATATGMPSPIESPIVGASFAQEEVEALAMPRTLVGIAQLSPGVTTFTPNAARVSISGAFAFDNVFALDGVEINVNPLGSPQNLFVEDAIAETQTLTSGISAEYGRFSGGVVNAITRSGGDRFSGSMRDELTNQRWSTRTPYEVFTQARHKDEIDSHVEGTAGGPIVRSRVWVFGAGRFEKASASGPLAETGAANTETDRNQRGELKLTATIESNHTVQAGYMNDRTENEGRPTLGTSIDPFAVGNRTVPDSFTFFNYQGVVGNGLLFQTQYSQERSGVRDAGGTSRDIVDSPFVTLSTRREYDAPYFDASDLEQRLSRQLALSAQREWTRGGRHALKGGYNWLRSQRTGGNEPSSTDYVFDADYVLDPRTELPALDSSGHLVPLFVPGDTRIEHSLPVRGSVLNVRTHTIYAQDKWAIDGHWSADLGVRYERVTSVATGGAPGVNTHSVVPRVAAAYDVKADGHYVVHVTYGRYSGRYNEGLSGANDSAGSVDTVFGTYKGPPGQSRAFAPGFDPANYTTDTGRFPSANVSIAPGLSAPITGEVTASFGSELGNRGFAEAAYVKRRTGNIIEDVIDINNGTTEVVRNGVDFGKVTNIVYANTDLATRDYQALVLQTRFKAGRRWSVRGHYTLMLKDDGNYEGAAANQPGASSPIGNYPGILDDVRHVPGGRLQDFQRSRLRVWSVYDFDMGRAGNLSVSGLWRVDSGQVFSLRASSQPITATQLALLAASGYPDAPVAQDVFFGGRGSQQFPGYALFDASVNYNIPVFRTLRPWVKLDVFNLFDNLKAIAWNTAVLQDRSGPTDSHGLAATYNPSPLFGQPDSNVDFPSALPGVAGGRTFRVALGVRF